MNVSDCLRDIYIGTFAEYITASNSLGAMVKEQSVLVNSLFKLEINLMQILQKYKKPVHPQEEDIFLEPIAKQINIIKNFTIENGRDCSYLHYISDSVDIFHWMKESDLEVFVERFSDYIIAYKDIYRDSSFGVKLSRWLETWTRILEEFSESVLTNFKTGLVWHGTENLPTQAVLGDKTEFRNYDHAALFKEINQGENITRILRRRNESAEATNSTSE
ncbi:unnamed protein product [Psylliodes chrysocephalus]|uniref:CAP N-terminal domain-containing protein n=1 Tax=Psylliodes chrysocephalus TaxID=3402493 RepID=A0A9P0CNS2_9CUCU|nr:unnamed protein product [Psylliodes chrysocephala]